MRIIGGEARGRRLAPLSGLDIRPTADKVKGAIFNLIGQDLADFEVLDLFAGTGGLGLEALSRGARHCIFVDRAAQAIQQIRKNISLCKYEARAMVVRQDLSQGLPQGPALGKSKFNLVFLDPPYGKGLVEKLLEEIRRQKLLDKGALLVAESSKRDLLPEQLGPIRMIKLKSYGDTKITIFEHEVDL
ncbi:MAG: 16S rRNA (guanine(966)-N(2))-methyltransferase RsmD [Desulfobacteraceae bacterium]|nr:MAG: 16S rRNA (guanine(966)-N(2))-methyltransferase RsmD [Desulfobacteraceae bacterium]